MNRMWGRCDHRHPWFPIEDPSLETSYLCPVCLEPATLTGRTFLRRFGVGSRRQRAG